jgi:hypothetical protein
MRAVFSFIALALFVIACKNNDGSQAKAASAKQSGWDSTNRYEFINECMEGEKVSELSREKAYAYCNCMLSKVEARFPVPDSTAQLDSATVQQMELDCSK